MLVRHGAGAAGAGERGCERGECETLVRGVSACGDGDGAGRRETLPAPPLRPPKACKRGDGDGSATRGDSCGTRGDGCGCSRGDGSSSERGADRGSEGVAGNDDDCGRGDGDGVGRNRGRGDGCGG
jgi:hypothetical protein